MSNVFRNVDNVIPLISWMDAGKPASPISPISPFKPGNPATQNVQNLLVPLFIFVLMAH